MKKFLLMLFVFILFACSKDPLGVNDENQSIETKKSVLESGFKESKFGEPMLLGEKIDNPYSVKSLKKARSVVVPTHYYVRFLPESNQEYGLLLKNIRCFPFPLDRKVIQGGSFYRDPDPANVGKRFSWQYAVVPAHQALPEVQYEILDELCIPENAEEQPITRGSGGSGTVGPPGPTSHKVVVRVWDTELQQFVPLEGLMVNAVNMRIGASLTYGITDHTGTAVIKNYFTVTDDIFYTIFWSDGKESKWFMTDDNNNQLFYNVKAVAGVTNIDIKSTPNNIVAEQDLGTIHRAAYRTYYKKNLDLVKPIHEDFIQVAYMVTPYLNYAGSYHSCTPYSDCPKIKIWGGSGRYIKATIEIFSTTAHEFGHLNHDVNSGRREDVMIYSEKIIKESWAVAVQKYLTYAEYATYGYSPHMTESLPYTDALEPSMREFVIPNTLNRQNWPFSSGHNEDGVSFNTMLPYSPLFIDLIDNENQQDYYYALGLKNNWAGTYYDSWYKKFPADNVKDFTIGELQNLLKTTNTLEDFHIKVKNLNNLHGNSKAAIDNLFVKFFEHWEKYQPATKGAEGYTPNCKGYTIYD